MTEYQRMLIDALQGKVVKNAPDANDWNAFIQAAQQPNSQTINPQAMQGMFSGAYQPRQGLQELQTVPGAPIPPQINNYMNSFGQIGGLR